MERSEIMSRQTPFFPHYAEEGAKIVDFHGWQLPVQFSGILAEHTAVRERAGLFDVSHMGEFWVTGPGALEAVNYLVTNDVSAIPDGKALYTPMCLPSGGIVDDAIVFRCSPHRIFIVVNAANAEKDYAWISQQLAGRADVANASDDFCQLALQGPLFKKILSAAGAVDHLELKSFQFKEGLNVAGVPCLVSRTGYTGENGYEIYINVSKHGEAAASTVWKAIMDAGRPLGLQPIGLGARDTLRFEACLMLYGNEIDENTTPLEAGIGWTVKFDKEDFLGREALIRQNEQGLTKQLTGLQLSSGAPPRQGYPVFHGNREVGRVTSGTRAPTLKANLALAYLPPELSEPLTALEVERRGRRMPAEVVKTPFYRRKRKKKAKGAYT